MRRIALPALMLAALAAGAQAQQRTRVEIGSQFGATLINGGGSTEVVVGVPGAGTLLGLFPVIYTTVWATPQVMVEPQVLFLYNSMSDDVDVSGVLQLGYRLNGTSRGSPFVAAHGGIFHESGSGSEWLVGGSLGYHYNLTSGAAVRMEGRYRYWTDSDIHDIAAAIGFAIRL